MGFDTLEYLDTSLESRDVAFSSNILELKIELIKWVIGTAFSFAGIMFVLLRFMLPS